MDMDFKAQTVKTYLRETIEEDSYNDEGREDLIDILGAPRGTKKAFSAALDIMEQDPTTNWEAIGAMLVERNWDINLSATVGQNALTADEKIKCRGLVAELEAAAEEMRSAQQRVRDACDALNGFVDTIINQIQHTRSDDVEATEWQQWWESLALFELSDFDGTLTERDLAQELPASPEDMG